ncbi:MAG TPA: sensor histidine kinase, partial [Burkholderiaceae bacterium]|nr:sensor histidine kinase [Burkholderiaceae bacterium]
RIDILARRDGDTLLLDVRDTGVGLAGDDAGDGSRFGIAQVRERLGALFGARASLTLQPADDAQGGTLARVRLPLSRP